MLLCRWPHRRRGCQLRRVSILHLRWWGRRLVFLLRPALLLRGPKVRWRRNWRGRCGGDGTGRRWQRALLVLLGQLKRNTSRREEGESGRRDRSNFRWLVLLLLWNDAPAVLCLCCSTSATNAILQRRLLRGRGRDHHRGRDRRRSNGRLMDGRHGRAPWRRRLLTCCRLAGILLWLLLRRLQGEGGRGSLCSSSLCSSSLCALCWCRLVGGSLTSLAAPWLAALWRRWWRRLRWDSTDGLCRRRRLSGRSRRPFLGLCRRFSAL